jgi:hypothetical protein
MTSPYPTYVSLPRKAVSHWSTASYGRGAFGHITAYPNAGGNVSNADDRTVLLNLDTPGTREEGLHGGARRIDIALTPKEARLLAKQLVATARQMEGR